MSGTGRDDEKQQALFAAIGELHDEESRREFLGQHEELCRPETVRRLAEDMNRIVRVDAREASAMAELAVLISERLDDGELRALSLRARGNARYALGDNQGALDSYEASSRIFEESGKPIELARVDSSAIQPLILLGRFDEAFAAAERARRIFEEANDQHRLARLLNNVGNILHRQDRFDEALMRYESAYEGILEFHEQDPEGVAGILSNMAVCLIVLNDFPRALETYRSARAFCESHQMPRLVAQADYNIAYLHYLRGEYSRALVMMREAKQDAERVGDLYHAALCDVDRAEIFLELNLFEEASEMAETAFQQFNELGTGHEAGKSLANLAFARSHQGRVAEALKFFRQARKIFVREQNRVWPSLIDLYVALVLCNEGRILESRKLCLRALSFFELSILPGKTVLCHLLLARLDLSVADLDGARRECEIALESLHRLDAPILSHQAHFLMGQVQAESGANEAASVSFESARQTLESLRSRLRGEELRIAFMKNKLAVYEELFELSWKHSQDRPALEKAFGYMEHAKSRSMSDLIFRPVHSLPALKPAEEELMNQVRGVREELNWFYHRMYQEELSPVPASPSRLAHLHTEARSREDHLVKVMRELPPPEAALLNPGVRSLKSVRAAMPPESALLEYFVVGDRLVAFVVTSDHLEVVPIEGKQRVFNILQMLQFQFAKFRLGESYVSDFKDVLLKATLNHLQELYRELIEPVSHLLNCSHLIVIPHGPLHQLPFHALFDGQSYLCDTHTVSYAPSASVYVHCHERSANDTGTALVLGVDDPQTPFIHEEAQAASAILPDSVLFLGDAASLETIQAHGPKSRLVHIATHGYFRGDNPMFSAIRLGRSYLNLYDLYQLNLPVELVTLSGCATGMNVVVGGDELLGLVRGLLYAGAQSLMVSLWDVQDRSTAELMTSFYRRMVEGHSKPKALQKAMGEVRERHPHPYYWAPFALIGKV